VAHQGANMTKCNVPMATTQSQHCWKNFWINLLVQRQNKFTHPFFWEGKSKGKQQLKKMWRKNFSPIIFDFERFRETLTRNGVKLNRISYNGCGIEMISRNGFVTVAGNSLPTKWMELSWQQFHFFKEL